MNKRESRRALMRARAQIRKSQRAKPRRMPRQLPPRAIEREYARELVRIAKHTRKALEPLMLALPSIMSNVRASNARLDAGPATRAVSLLRRVKKRLVIDQKDLRKIAKKFANRTEKYATKQLTKQVIAAVGADPFVGNPGLLVSAKEIFQHENVALMENLGAKTFSEIEGIVFRGVASGTGALDIQREIRKRVAISERRAKVIARDQINTLYGAVNKAKQESVGISRFIWRTSHDERVRDEHIEIDGQEFDWATGHPIEGIPGSPINCRCYASPVLDGLL